MKRATAGFVVAALVLTSACGSDSDGGGVGKTGRSSAAGATSASTTPIESATTAASEPAYALLSKRRLEDALLKIEDMPVGYSQDPPSEQSTKTFCDYVTPFDEKVSVMRDFTKGGGVSAELLRVGLRQYASADQARAAFDALTTALSTCKGETYDGSKLVYSPMSAPHVGDGSVGVRITADGYTLLQNFALVGPTLVSTGGGGLADADADEIAGLLEAQVVAYQGAATP